MAASSSTQRSSEPPKRVLFALRSSGLTHLRVRKLTSSWAARSAERVKSVESMAPR